MSISGTGLRSFQQEVANAPPLATGNPRRGIATPAPAPNLDEEHIMNKPTLHRAIAAAAAAAITLSLFSAIVSIAAEDQATLAAARSVHTLVATKAPETTNR
jgi:uncharacterized protein YfaQ (DUF2300 family)